MQKKRKNLCGLSCVRAGGLCARVCWWRILQTTEGLLDHTSLGGTVRTRRLEKERLVNAGTVIGLDEQLMQAPYRCTYVTSSFVHLFFFDKTQVMAVWCGVVWCDVIGAFSGLA